MSTDDALLDYFPTGRVRRPAGPHGARHARRRAAGHGERERHRGRGGRAAARGWSTSTPSRCTARWPAASSRGRRRRSSTSARAITTVVISAARDRRASSGRCPPAARTSPSAVASALGIAAAEAEAVKREVGIGYAVGPERADAAEAISTVRPCAGRVGPQHVRLLLEQQPRRRHRRRACSPAAARTSPASGSTCRARAGCPVTLGDPLAGLRSAKTVQRESLNGHESFIALPVGPGLRSCRMTTLLERPQGRPSAGTALSGTLPAGQPAAARGPRGARAARAPSAGSSIGLVVDRRSSCVGAFGARARSRARRQPRELAEAQAETARLAERAGQVRRGAAGARRARPARRGRAQLGMSTEVAVEAVHRRAHRGAARRRQHRRRSTVTGATPMTGARAPTDPLQAPSVGQIPFTARTHDRAGHVRVDRRAELRPRLRRRLGVVASPSPRTSPASTTPSASTVQVTDAAYSHRFDATRRGGLTWPARRRAPGSAGRSSSALVIVAAAWFLAISPTLAAAAEIAAQAEQTRGAERPARDAGRQAQGRLREAARVQGRARGAAGRRSRRARCSRDYLRQLDQIAVAHSVTLTTIAPASPQTVVRGRAPRRRGRPPRTPRRRSRPTATEATPPSRRSTARRRGRPGPAGARGLHRGPVRDHGRRHLRQHHGVPARPAERHAAALPRDGLHGHSAGRGRRRAVASPATARRRPGARHHRLHLRAAGRRSAVPAPVDPNAAPPALPGAVPGKNPLVPIAGR